MRRKRAFTLAEISVVVIIVTIVLGLLYKIFSGVMDQMFKSSNKMTNLRAASLILERLKSDIRCSVKPDPDRDEEPEIDETKISFITTSNEGNNTEGKSSAEYRRRVTYLLEGDQLKRSTPDKDRKISTAKVSKFNIQLENAGDISTSRYIIITIVVDNKLNPNNSRTFNSKNNQVELKAVLYPRFFDKNLTDEEKYWYNTPRPRLDES